MRITGTLHEDICAVIMYCWILLKMRNVSDKSCRENQNDVFVHKCGPRASPYELSGPPVG